MTASRQKASPDLVETGAEAAILKRGRSSTRRKVKTKQARKADARILREMPAPEFSREGGKRRRPRSGETASGDRHGTKFRNAISHKILIERAREAPIRIESDKISEASRLIIEGTMVVLAKALRRLADK